MPHGVLLISDIDHTLKLHNTATMTPPVPGMPHLLASWVARWNNPPTDTLTIKYLTNRWGPLGLLGFGSHAFLSQHYPPGDVFERGWYDIVGWISRSVWHKSSTLSRGGGLVLPSAQYNVVILLGDDVDFDAEVYTNAVRGGHVGGSVATIIAIRIVFGGLSESEQGRQRWRDLTQGLPKGVHTLLHKDTEELSAMVDRVISVAQPLSTL